MTRSRRKVDGYIWRQELNKAFYSTRAARAAVGKILDEDPGHARLALLLALISQHLGDTLDSLHQLQEFKTQTKNNGGD